MKGQKNQKICAVALESNRPFGRGDVELQITVLGNTRHECLNSTRTKLMKIIFISGQWIQSNDEHRGQHTYPFHPTILEYGNYVGTEAFTLQRSCKHKKETHW